MLKWFSRRLRELHEKEASGEAGFTLIELLVVVIIIGILAAIAIPIFLAQRENAQDRAAQSDLRNAATAQVSALSETGNYVTAVGPVAGANNDLRDFGFRPSNGVAAVDINIYTPADATHGRFCMDTQWAGSGRNFRISEEDTSVESGVCP